MEYHFFLCAKWKNEILNSLRDICKIKESVAQTYVLMSLFLFNFHQSTTSNITSSQQYDHFNICPMLNEITVNAMKQ